MFEIGKRYTVDMPVGTITESGIREIALFIEKQKLNEGDWLERNPDNTRRYLNPLPENWNYQWVITGRGEYVGTFPKRVSKYYWQEYQLRCPNSFVAELGQIARRNSADNSSYIIDFTDSLDWQAGDYGDSGSCLWGSNEHGREIMQDNGVMAVRFYHSDGSGYGRAWLYQYSETKQLWIVWNGYGVNGSTIAIARVLGQLWGVSYKKITLRNNGVSSGAVWINGDSGYVIGQADKLTDIRSFDLNFDVPHSCENCGDELREDDRYFDPDGDTLCSDCFYDMCDYCAHCGETYWNDDLYVTEPHGEYVCEYCLDRHYTRCDRCELYHRDRHMTETKEGHFCEGCMPE